MKNNNYKAVLSNNIILQEVNLILYDIITDLSEKSFKNVALHGELLDLSNFNNISSPSLVMQPSSNVDLCISNLCLTMVEDFNKTLRSYKESLSENGLVIATLLGSASLTELKIAMMETDYKLFNGVMPHVNQIVSIKTLGNIFKSVFDIVVCDSSIIEVEYDSVMDLIEEIRQLNFNKNKHKNNKYLGKEYIKTLESTYKEQNNGLVNCTYEVLTITAC